ncbi:valine--tRNA ligase [Ilyomonas limi]|uniref:Valine--tRNA ligase n=1 Tax=Ilyomonas limi TaxID=2575867 RepID=A0A4U3L5Q9_9BACT|nr:valine--tRNA ligase [Ilyomonas limi]TKK68957.1 valine--tRNA ligase [Ilyomonas limi]
MELSKNYTPAAIEDKWYQLWLKKGYFNSTPDERTPFTVVIPPPNVTGVLHMGHTLNETVQDILVRKARMSGYNACWVPGSDHASIATEAKVVQMLKEKGIDKNSLSREAFLQYAFEWKEKYGGIIYSQIAKLGCSVDWNRVTFTMDDHYYKAVIKVFVEMYNQGLLYRGARMINWDVQAKTALSDEEVEYRDIEGKLYYVKYKIVDSYEITDDSNAINYITVATQRPETIMGDVAVCVNPNDERYTHLHGKKVMVPLINKAVPVITDEYVDPAFGTGALKITPAHDIHDYEIGLKHHLEVIDTLTEDGKISEAGQVFIGLDRFEARKRAVEQLKEEGLLIKEEEYTTRLGFSQRTNVVVEPRISTQWFVRMKELAGPALEAVTSGNIAIHPGDKFLATYKYWLENVKDWCISRQLWWGQQIPAWYDENGRIIVAENEAAARELYSGKYGVSNAQLRQDADVLDTWFSSWLWPIEVFYGITNPGNKDVEYYYPTNVLVTGQDIIFFWVARMIMAGMQFKQEKPFSDVYFTGMVRDKLGRKMSKSLGNSPDLLVLIDKYGADAVRFGIMISSPAGNDLLFDEAALEQGRNFNNKLWNAMKLVKMWEEKQAGSKKEQTLSNGEEGSGESAFAVQWFENRLSEVRGEVEDLMKGFKLSEALKTIYSLIWDDFCSWYLEWVKPGFEQPVNAAIYQKTIAFFDDLLQLLHPFMPFITEEIYHLLKERTDDLCVKQFAPLQPANTIILAEGALLKAAITTLRDARNKNGLKPKDAIQLYIQSENSNQFKASEHILVKQVNAEGIAYTEEPVPNTIVVTLEKDKFFIAAENKVDVEALRNELLKDMEYQKRFVESVMKKLTNEKFLQNAKPEVVALERKKKMDAEARIKTIEESLINL